MTRVEYVRESIPAHLVTPTPAPVCSHCETNGDLLGHALDLREALNRCNADKAAIAASIKTDGEDE